MKINMEFQVTHLLISKQKGHFKYNFCWQTVKKEEAEVSTNAALTSSILGGVF